MLKQAIQDAWGALTRRKTRSFLTMAGIVWGIVAVTMLIAYGGGFREVLVSAFEAFGKGAVICWPGQTSEQAGGQRAGKKVVFEQTDLYRVRAQDSLVKTACLETVRFLSITYEDRLINTATRGVCPEYGDMRNEVPAEGRWLNSQDELERRRVVFLGRKAKDKLFSGRPAIGQEVSIGGMRFTVIGIMDRKLQLSNYFTSDDESVYIPYSAAGDLWNTRYASVMLFVPVSARFEAPAEKQVLATVAERQGFSPTDKKAIQMFGREEFRPVIDGLTIGLEGLLTFIGALTLGIGGVGVMNIMLVSVDERVREIGLRRALGATKRNIQLQFLTEAMLMMVVGGVVGIFVSYLIAAVAPQLPMLGPLFEDTTGKGDIQLNVSLLTVAISFFVLFVVGMLCGWVPARKASGLDPVEALRYE